jgi:DNA polymerase III delta prime subunit
MWVKKYAPESYNDIAGNTQLVERFRTMSSGKYVQHMILCGPPGVGKWTLVQLLMHSILGTEHLSAGSLVFQSTDEKGNHVIREKIRQFVPKRIHADAPKFVVFKQADQLSDGAQQIMRRLMELHYHHAVFIFICSDLSRMLQTIQSRCHIYQFNAVPVAEQVARLKCIAEAEGVVVVEEKEDEDEDGDAHLSPSYSPSSASSNKNPGHTDNNPLERIAQMSNGDMRACINYFQSACSALSSVDECARSSKKSKGKRLSMDTVQTVCLFPHYNQIKEIADSMLLVHKHPTDEHRAHQEFFRCMRVVRGLYHQGYCGLDIAMFFQTYLVTAHDHLPRSVCMSWFKDVAVCHSRLTKGVDSAVQLYGLLANMFRGALHCAAVKGNTSSE